MAKRKNNLATKFGLRFPTFRKQSKSPIATDQQIQNGGTLMKGKMNGKEEEENGRRSEMEPIVVIVDEWEDGREGGGMRKINLTERKKELEELVVEEEEEKRKEEEMGRRKKEEERWKKIEEEIRWKKEKEGKKLEEKEGKKLEEEGKKELQSAKVAEGEANSSSEKEEKMAKIVHFGKQDDIIGGGGEEDNEEERRKREEDDEAEESDMEDNVEEMEGIVKRERMRWERRRMEEEKGEGRKTEEQEAVMEKENAFLLGTLKKVQKEEKDLAELENGTEKMEMASTVQHGGEEMAETNSVMSNNNHTNGETTAGQGNEVRDIEDLRSKVARMELKLLEANQEKNYYKKHFKGEGHDNQNGHGQHDDFGKELLMANKRKYQLESRIKHLESELREAQQRASHLGESVRSMEKLLWLEKERSATLEQERQQMGFELEELRRNGETLKRELDEMSGDGTAEGAGKAQKQQQQQEALISRQRAEQEQKMAELREMKNKMEWRLGEMTQQYHDTKWRMGETEATLAHRDWELEQANNRIKQLEASVAATPSATANEEMEELKAEIARKTEEKGKLEWRLGEVNQCWSDAKWRLGELEAENAHRSLMLDQAHHRIGELERRLAGNFAYDELRREKEASDRKMERLNEMLRDGTFLIRKKAHSDRNKWKLLTFENALNEEVRLKRCWFEAEADGSDQVLLIGSFTNWECALLCDPIPERPSRRGVWIDLPPGRFEFRFFRDGKWHTELGYGECWNEYGAKNNWIDVD